MIGAVSRHGKLFVFNANFANKKRSDVEKEAALVTSVSVGCEKLC
jgi:hypothetical protein